MKRFFSRDTRLCDVGEQAALDAIFRAVGGKGERGDAPGDDAALVSIARGRLVVSSDMLVEGQDFRLSWATPKDIGHKAAMANLSDLAAMGATPRGLLLSIAMQKTARARDLVALVEAAHVTGAVHGAPVVGGDLSETDGPLVVSVTVLGEAAHPAFLRHRARRHDLICVTGTLGDAAAGLSCLETPASFAALPRATQARLRQAQLRPQAPVAFAAALARARLVRSAADLSDGLLADGLHLVREGYGITIDATRLPISNAVQQAAQALSTHVQAARRRAWQWALFGGEDFGLLFALPRAHLLQARRLSRAHGVRLSVIGLVNDTPGIDVWPAAADALRTTHFAHFRAGTRA